MHISLTPMRCEAQLELSVQGDTLVVNGERFDFSAVPEGATLPKTAIASAWFSEDVTRKDGVLSFGLIVPHGANAPDETLFPTPITVTEDGLVDLPPYQLSAAEPAEKE